jgi:hypothetical protein
MGKKTNSIKVTQYDYLIRNFSDDELEIQGHLNNYTEFDFDGRPVKEITYNQDGSFEEMITHEYDSGKLIRECYYPAEDELAEQYFYRYDDTGKIVQATKQYQDGSSDTIEYHYNEAGLLTTKETINDEQETEQVERFEYEDGKLVRHETFDGEGDLIPVPLAETLPASNTRIERNEAGQIVSEEDLNEEGEVIMSVKRTYNPDGEPDEVEVYLDGQGRRISRHYVLKYEYTYFD